jgi:MFS superfamily sulfate permease-like transporter
MQDRQRFIGDLSGAFADLGTFLPIVLGVLALQQMDPSGLFIGFGLFALCVALIYRRPIPVQPMKAVAAIVIAGHLDAATVAATGVLLGLVLLTLYALGVINELARRIPQSVLSGVQLGIGLTLTWAGLRLVQSEWLMGGITLLLLTILQQTKLRAFTVFFVIIGTSCWSLFMADVNLPVLHPGWHWPPLITFDWDDLKRSSTTILLPQLILTLTNAVVVTAAIAGELFPRDAARISPNRLALSTGALNLILAPFGAFPMCHGAGGLVVQHQFGARTGLAPAIFGLSCLTLGFMLGSDALKLLQLLPLASVGALLAFAGFQLAMSKKLFELQPRQLGVVLITGLCCLVFNVAVGLLVGLVAEWLSNQLSRQLAKVRR